MACNKHVSSKNTPILKCKISDYDEWLKEILMATSKSGGSTQNGRESHSKRLGVKLFDGQRVSGGEIIIRQRGTRIHPGGGVGRGGDDTLFARMAGTVFFHYGPRGRKYVSVRPHVDNL